jgi:hypothetical protein
VVPLDLQKIVLDYEKLVVSVQSTMSISFEELGTDNDSLV